MNSSRYKKHGSEQNCRKENNGTDFHSFESILIWTGVRIAIWKAKIIYKSVLSPPNHGRKHNILIVTI